MYMIMEGMVKRGTANLRFDALAGSVEALTATLTTDRKYVICTTC
jgi:hypothetical protein